MTESLQRPATKQQITLMRTAIDIFRQHGQWPAYNYIDSELDRVGISAKPVLESIPYVWITPDKRSQGGVANIGPEEQVTVTITGLYHCDHFQGVLDLYFSALRWAIDARAKAQMPSPTEYVEPKWTFEDFLNGLDGQPLLNDATLVLALMRWERDMPQWAGPPEDPYSWTITISPNIKDYRDLQDIGAYVRFRQQEMKEWLEPRGAGEIGAFVEPPAIPPAAEASLGQTESWPPEIAGALARFWSGGDGPSHSAISTAFSLAGYEENQNASNKEERVRRALRSTEPELAKRVTEELLDLLRTTGIFETDADDPRLRTLRRAFERGGFTLSPEGFPDWGDPNRQTPVDTALHEPTSEPTETEVKEVAIPTPSLLVQILQRLPAALKPLIHRRQGRQGLPIRDEYDLQDAVEALLRALYNDVRSEERGPSSAGSSSTMDFLLREDAIAVEVKVTRPGRDEKAIKKELLVDINDYKAHPAVRRLIFAVYDVADTFRNPTGFETDLSGTYGTMEVQVVVVGWPLRAD